MNSCSSDTIKVAIAVVACLWLFGSLDSAQAKSSSAGSEISITAPVNGQTVSGKTVAVRVALGPDVYWDQLLVDATAIASGSGNFIWDSTTVVNGRHTVMVKVFQKGGTKPIGSAWVSVQVSNPAATATPTPVSTPTPTPARTPTPTPTPVPSTPTPQPTPSNVGNEVTITAPANGQTVSGKAVAVNVALGPDVYWDQLMVDGTSVSSTSGNFTWDSTTVSNGQHTLTVRAFQKGGTVPIGSAWVVVNVSNTSPGATPTPTPTATSTPTPTPTPVYFLTLSANAALPTDGQCAALIPATAETAPWNTAFNQVMPTAAQLASYATGGYTFDYRDSYVQYERVDGQYTGSTDMIMRWAACKYGVDENVVRAQGWVESGWRQGGAGDKRTTLSACVQASFTALWNTTVTEPDGSLVSCSNCCYQSWSAWQTKVFYEWMTWPEIMQSTSFAADYRYADQRACMDGAYTSYFSSTAQQPNTYAGDIANYKSNPGTANTNRALWGCIGMHFSGSWYDSAAQTYISQVQNVMTTAPWPH